MPSPRLNREEFRRRFLSQYQDPVFEPLAGDLERLAAAAWDVYEHHRKAPRTQKAGGAFADPEYDLDVDWLQAREACARLRASTTIPTGLDASS
jgi:hypothetical protein